jgi:hypothetical protein
VPSTLFGPGGIKSECTDQLSYTSGLFSSEDKVCTKEEKGLYIFSFTSLKQKYMCYLRSKEVYFSSWFWKYMLKVE